ncbi:MAG: hypothetical protein R6U17_01490 [Thermoplasmata archaeon]
MADRSATELIWFAVTVVITISLVGVFVGIAYNYSSGIQDSAREQAANYYVNIEIINDPSSVPYNETTGDLTLYVKNTGKYRLDISQIIVSLSGNSSYVNESQVEVLGNNSDWTAGTVAEINLSISSLQAGRDHFVWVEVRGIFGGNNMGRGQDSLEFYLHP